jgi:hypothetical protein
MTPERRIISIWTNKSMQCATDCQTRIALWPNSWKRTPRIVVDKRSCTSSLCKIFRDNHRRSAHQHTDVLPLSVRCLRPKTTTTSSST